jgi:hypothetical protein
MGAPTVWQLTSLIRLRPPQSEWAKKDTRCEQHKQGEPCRRLLVMIDALSALDAFKNCPFLVQPVLWNQHHDRLADPLDLLMIEGATGKFLLQQMAAVAELEAGMISARTKAALAAAKRRGVKLGGDRGARLTAKARAAGRAAVQERARNRAIDLAPTIVELRTAGCESLRAIAAGLEERGIPAARGGKWSAVQVARLLEAAGSPFEGVSVAAA